MNRSRSASERPDTILTWMFILAAVGFYAAGCLTGICFHQEPRPVSWTADSITCPASFDPRSAGSCR